jgi:hypothetical protein
VTAITESSEKTEKEHRKNTEKGQPGFHSLIDLKKHGGGSPAGKWNAFFENTITKNM